MSYDWQNFTAELQTGELVSYELTSNEWRRSRLTLTIRT